MRVRFLSLALTICMTLTLVPTAFAATKSEIDQPEVFLKQENSGTCTLVATAMMLRRTAMLRGDQDWHTITEASCRAAFWTAGRGLPYNFEYDGMTVTHQWLPGGAANRDYLIAMLEQHPEGLMLHARGVPHGILLTDYTDGVFYCADSAVHKPHGRIPIDQAYGTRVENSTAIWYVVTPDVALEAEPPVLPPLPEPAAIPASTVLAAEQPEGESLSLLMAQVMTRV